MNEIGAGAAGVIGLVLGAATAGRGLHEERTTSRSCSGESLLAWAMEPEYRRESELGEWGRIRGDEVGLPSLPLDWPSLFAGVKEEKAKLMRPVSPLPLEEFELRDALLPWRRCLR